LIRRVVSDLKLTTIAPRDPGVTPTGRFGKGEASGRIPPFLGVTSFPDASPYNRNRLKPLSHANDSASRPIHRGSRVGHVAGLELPATYFRQARIVSHPQIDSHAYKYKLLQNTYPEIYNPIPLSVLFAGDA
jgi:hypothetical protein